MSQLGRPQAEREAVHALFPDLDGATAAFRDKQTAFHNGAAWAQANQGATEDMAYQHALDLEYPRTGGDAESDSEASRRTFAAALPWLRALEDSGVNLRALELYGHFQGATDAVWSHQIQDDGTVRLHNGHGTTIATIHTPADADLLAGAKNSAGRELRFVQGADAELDRIAAALDKTPEGSPEHAALSEQVTMLQRIFG